MLAPSPAADTVTPRMLVRTSSAIDACTPLL
jgi:hypothetical protein